MSIDTFMKIHLYIWIIVELNKKKILNNRQNINKLYRNKQLYTYK